MDSKYHDDWQSTKKTVLERNTHMFDNELMSDVSFTCGEFISRTFHAHKYVLATSSAVFYAMFYGNLAQKESTIRITDADEESFNEFLRFLYTDDCKITAENAIGVMYLAKKYLISPLAEKCCKALEASIRSDNVFVVLEQAVKFDESDLEAKCWDIVSSKTQECITTEAFCNIGPHTLNALLKSEVLVIAEVDLFKAVLKWVDSECARQGINIEDDKMARRRILGDSLYEIRFLAMSQHDFATYASPTGILTYEEMVGIFQKLNGLDAVGLKWKNKGSRRLARMVSFGRFELANIIGSITWYYVRNLPDTLSLVVNKAVLFHGVRLFGDAGGSRYDVKFKIKDKDDNITGTYTSEQDSDGVWGYDIMLSKPIALLRNEEVTIVALINGPPSYRGQNGKSSVKVDDVIVTFKNATGDSSTNGTGYITGQFYKIFLSSAV